MGNQSQHDRARQHFRFTDKEMDDYESDLTRGEILDYACAFANKETAQRTAENEELKKHLRLIINNRSAPEIQDAIDMAQKLLEAK